jgi:hypothetical protein
MCRPLAIHLNGTVVSARNRRAIASFAADEIGLGRFDHEMKMIAHETPGMNAPAGPGGSFGEGFEEANVVVVIAEDGLTAVATIHDEVDRAGI